MRAWTYLGRVDDRAVRTLGVQLRQLTLTPAPSFRWVLFSRGLVPWQVVEENGL